MLTSSRIALIAASALALTAILAQAVTLLARPGTSNSPRAYELMLVAVLVGLIVGLLVWIGTYFGARLSKSEQRTYRLAKSLAALYVAIGIVLSLPFKTHAVKLDLPIPGRPAPATDWMPLLVGFSVLLSMVIVPLIVTRIMAAAIARTKRDA